jgi:hypothetical protein
MGPGDRHPGPPGPFGRRPTPKAEAQAEPARRNVVLRGTLRWCGVSSALATLAAPAVAGLRKALRTTVSAHAAGGG